MYSKLGIGYVQYQYKQTISEFTDTLPIFGYIEGSYKPALFKGIVIQPRVKTTRNGNNRLKKAYKKNRVTIGGGICTCPDGEFLGYTVLEDNIIKETCKNGYMGPFLSFFESENKLWKDKVPVCSNISVFSFSNDIKSNINVYIGKIIIAKNRQLEAHDELVYIMSGFNKLIKINDTGKRLFNENLRNQDFNYERIVTCKGEDMTNITSLQQKIESPLEFERILSKTEFDIKDSNEFVFKS